MLKSWVCSCIALFAVAEYFPVDHDSRVASSSYTKGVSPHEWLCRICWEFDQGVPPTRTIRGLALVSLKDLEKKECPPGKVKK